MKLTYAITVCTEIDEVVRLINHIKANSSDEIVVQYDETKADETLIDTLKNLSVVVISTPFENDFAKFKNNLSQYCLENGSDYIFQLDADEMISEFLIKNVNDIIKKNPRVDLFYVPRINIVDGIDKEHILKWGWNYDANGFINFPDYQGRLFRSFLKWSGKVHERIVERGYYGTFDVDEKFCIIHHKTIAKQISQNKFYLTI